MKQVVVLGGSGYLGSRVVTALEQLEGVEPALVEIVVKAMKRKATDRYETALDMRLALLGTGLCANEQRVRAWMEELFLTFLSR